MQPRSPVASPSSNILTTAAALGLAHNTFTAAELDVFDHR
jgi:hypothetical protein